jgi:hypothetical protein
MRHPLAATGARALSTPGEVGEKMAVSVATQKVDRMSLASVHAESLPGNDDEMVLAPVLPLRRVIIKN